MSQDMELPVGKTVWIARHGNRVDFVDPAWKLTAERGHDPHLSPDGLLQARQLGRRLAAEGVRHLFASPFLRTVETAAQVARAAGLKVKIEHGAAEWLNPEWFSCEPDYLSPQEMQRRFGCIDLEYRSRGAARWPEVDMRAHMQQRCTPAVRRIVQEFDGNLVFIGHGASMAGFTWGLLGEEPELQCGLCRVVKLVWNGRRWVLELNGDGSHLSTVEEELRFH